MKGLDVLRCSCHRCSEYLSKGYIIVLQFFGKCLNLYVVAVCDIFYSLEA